MRASVNSPDPRASLAENGLPIGREARAEVFALFEGFAIDNRAKPDKAAYRAVVPGSASHVHLYGRDFRCHRGDKSLPPGLWQPSNDARAVALRASRSQPSLQLGRQRALAAWMWRTRRAPIRFEGLTPEALRPLNVAGRIPALQWRGTYVDGAGRRREMRLVASRAARRFPWRISHYDYCPGTQPGVKITLPA